MTDQEFTRYNDNNRLGMPVPLGYIGVVSPKGISSIEKQECCLEGILRLDCVLLIHLSMIYYAGSFHLGSEVASSFAPTEYLR